jgi:hypothetical protein
MSNYFRIRRGRKTTERVGEPTKEKLKFCGLI